MEAMDTLEVETPRVGVTSATSENAKQLYSQLQKEEQISQTRQEDRDRAIRAEKEKSRREKEEREKASALAQVNAMREQRERDRQAAARREAEALRNQAEADEIAKERENARRQHAGEGAPESDLFGVRQRQKIELMEQSYRN